MDALQPITTSLLSVLFFNLHLTLIEIIGIALVIIAVYILQDGRRKALTENDLHY